MPQTIFVPRIDAILTAASESISFFLLLSFTVMFTVLLLSLLVLTSGDEDSAGWSHGQAGSFEITKYCQGQP